MARNSHHGLWSRETGKHPTRDGDDGECCDGCTEELRHDYKVRDAANVIPMDEYIMRSRLQWTREKVQPLAQQDSA